MFRLFQTACLPDGSRAKQNALNAVPTVFARELEIDGGIIEPAQRNQRLSEEERGGRVAMHFGKIFDRLNVPSH